MPPLEKKFHKIHDLNLLGNKFGDGNGIFRYPLTIKMDDTYKIFVRRLADGQDEVIAEILPPDFLDVSEAELAFKAPVKIEGRAAVSGESFVLQLSVETMAVMPCAICSQDVSVKISIPNFYHTEGIEGIKGDVFDYRGVLREAILLEVPQVAECEGNCPERKTLSKYFAKER